MDPQFTASREELYHVQMDVKHVQAVQLNHADRLLRLEKRQADDAALKSVWGTCSPFPGVLSGTPQQGPVQNPTNDVFDDFDDEQGQNILGSLHLEADEEPVRRGASRANSVRFDVSALQGSNWAAGSRNSGEFGPMRPNSGFGGHPMTERSLSHKSDGRHSSAGHSVHSLSGRTSSLGLDTNFMIGGQDDESPLDIPDPPAGLFILGTVPSIIRCWLTTNFSHNDLLYAAVCSGSQRSILDFALVKDLGLVDHMQKDASGRHTIRIHVYLPEAIITQATSRSNSPAPQLPTLSADFEVIGVCQRTTSGPKKGIRVFLGSDALRAHNADILFSQNLMTLYGDDRNKISVPFVRPEDDNTFKDLCTTNIPPEKNELKATALSFTPTESKPKIDPSPDAVTAALGNEVQEDKIILDNEQPPPLSVDTLSPTDTGFSSNRHRASSVKSAGTSANGNISDSEKHLNTDSSTTDLEPSDTTTSDTARRESSGGIWGSWRQGNMSANGTESETTSGYQKATRGAGRSMKVLKPSSKSATSAPLAAPAARSSSRTGATYEPAPTRLSGELRRKSQVEKQENMPYRWEPKRVNSEEQKAPKSIATIPRSSNPVGGASAFAWMNAGKPKTAATSAE